VSQKEVDKAARFYESLFKEETAISLPSPDLEATSPEISIPSSPIELHTSSAEIESPSPDLGATSPGLSIPSSPIELHTSSAEIESPSPMAIPETPCSSRLGSQTKERKPLLPKQKGNKQVNLTKLRAMAKKLGIEMPCRKCKENESSCPARKREVCDVYQHFASTNEETNIAVR